MEAAPSRTQKPKSRQADQLATGKWPMFRQNKFAIANLFYRLEILKLVALVARNKTKLKKRTIDIYLGSDNSNASPIRGDSDTEIIAMLVCALWRMAQAISLTVWIGGVAPKLNIYRMSMQDIKPPHTRPGRDQYSKISPNLRLKYKEPSYRMRSNRTSCARCMMNMRELACVFLK